MYAEVLIIGAGPAGFSAAKAAAKRGKQVALAGSEPFPPYWRPRLSEIISTGEPAERIFMRSTDQIKKDGITFMPAQKAVKISPSEKRVYWKDGSFSVYGSLIAAPGSYPIIPKVPFAGKIYSLRSYRDAVEIRRECLLRKRAFIVGGGVLGIETAFAVSKLGVSPEVYDIHDYPLSRQLDMEGGIFLKRKLEDKGIKMYSGTGLSALRGEIEGACVIAAAGVRSNISLAKECGIKTNRGIITDKYMRTSSPDIYACGDAAEFSGMIPGLMAVASKQGEIAGINAAGGSAEYAPVLPSPVMRAADVSIMSIGSLDAIEGGKILRRINGENYAAAAVSPDGKLTGAAFIGDISSGTKFKKLIENGGYIGAAESLGDIEKIAG